MNFSPVRFNKPSTSALDLLSKFPVGSSANTIAGFAINALAIATLCCDSYQAVLPYKDKIRDFKILHQEKEIVLRYPLFSLEERMNLDLQYRALIHQFFI